MPVAGVGVERHVQDDADVDTGVADGTGCAADEIVRVEGFASIVGAQFRVRVGEESKRRNSEIGGLLGGFDDQVHGDALDAGHRGDRHARRLPLDHEQRPDQVVDAEPILGDEPPRPMRATVSAHPNMRKA